MGKAVIFDLDATIADMTHRLDPRESKPDWSEANKGIKNDLPIEDTAIALRAFREQGAKIIIISGRRNESLPATIEWLNFHELPFDEIYLRPIRMEADRWKVMMFGLMVELHTVIESWGDKHTDRLMSEKFDVPFVMVHCLTCGAAEEMLGTICKCGCHGWKDNPYGPSALKDAYKDWEE